MNHTAYAELFEAKSQRLAELANASTGEVADELRDLARVLHRAAEDCGEFDKDNVSCCGDPHHHGSGS